MSLRIAVPAKVYCNAKFTMSLIAALSKIKAATGYNPEVKFLCGKSNIDQARSMLINDWYSCSKAQDLFLFIDSDHVFNIKDIEKAISMGSDVSCGVYSNSAGKPACFIMNSQEFIKNREGDIRYAGTGFMLIRRPILVKIAEYLKKEDGYGYARISPRYPKVIPFFKQRIIDSEVSETTDRDWLGEDYSFCWLVRKVGGSIKGFLTNTLGHEVANVKFFYPPSPLQEPITLNKEHVVKAEPEKCTVRAEPEECDIKAEPEKCTVKKETEECTEENWKGLNIVYFCGFSMVKFDPRMNNMTGSEQAVINLSKEWTKLGNTVTVYGNVNKGNYENVAYNSWKKFNNKRKIDILIVWRMCGLKTLLSMYRDINIAKTLILDMHDAIPQSIPSLELFDYVCVKSDWHKSQLNIKQTDKAKALVIKNGIDIDLYKRISKENIVRQPHRICYTSCYTRGLFEMLKYSWPIIKNEVPDAELHIYYGTHLIAGSSVKKQIHDLINSSKGVFDHGRVDREEIAREKYTSSVHFYICSNNKTETDCISVRESHYSGCMPVINSDGVFKERSGLHISNPKPDTNIQYYLAAKSIVNLFSKENSSLLEKFQKMPQSETSWKSIAQEWINQITPTS